MPTGQAFAFLGGVVYGCAAADAALGWCEWLCRLGGAHADIQKNEAHRGGGLMFWGARC